MWQLSVSPSSPSHLLSTHIGLCWHCSHHKPWKYSLNSSITAWELEVPSPRCPWPHQTAIYFSVLVQKFLHLTDGVLLHCLSSAESSLGQETLQTVTDIKKKHSPTLMLLYYSWEIPCWHIPLTEALSQYIHLLESDIIWFLSQPGFQVSKKCFLFWELYNLVMLTFLLRESVQAQRWCQNVMNSHSLWCIYNMKMSG